MQEADRSRIIEKIQKLLRMAEGKSNLEGVAANANEAAIAARQAEALMRKHNLEMRDVILEDLKKTDAIGTAWTRAAVNMHSRSYHKRVPQWAGFIAVPCSRLFDCYAVEDYVKDAGKVVRFIGYSLDVEICRWTFDYLIATVRRLSSDFIARTSASTTEADSYRMGLSLELRDKLGEALAEKNKAEQAGKASTNSALVAKAKQSAIIKKYPWLDGAVRDRKVSVGDVSAYLMGRADAEKINLSPNPVEHKPSRKPVSGLLK